MCSSTCQGNASAAAAKRSPPKRPVLRRAPGKGSGSSRPSDSSVRPSAGGSAQQAADALAEYAAVSEVGRPDGSAAQHTAGSLGDMAGGTLDARHSFGTAVAALLPAQPGSAPAAYRLPRASADGSHWAADAAAASPPQQAANRSGGSGGSGGVIRPVFKRRRMGAFKAPRQVGQENAALPAAKAGSGAGSGQGQRALGQRQSGSSQ